VPPEPTAVIVALVVAAVAFGLGALVQRRRGAPARARLAERDAELSLILDHAPDAVLVFDARRRCTRANGAASALFARDADALIGSDIDALLRPHDAPSDGRARASSSSRDPRPLSIRLCALERGATLVDELRVRNDDGALVPVEASLGLAEDGRIVAVVRDVTERHRLEHERLELERGLARAQHLQSLDLLAGSVAHDFEHLLAMMRDGIDDAAGALGDHPAQLMALDRLRGGVRQARKITRSLLDYAGTEAMPRSPQDLDTLVAEMLQLVGTRLQQGTELHIELEHDLPRVSAHPGRMRQVVLNLLLNALQAVRGRDGNVHLSTARVAPGEPLAGAGTGDLADRPWVALTVRDDGVGMSELVQARIFEPFYSNTFGGRGLGLAAVRGIVRSHGGRILVESRLDQGSTFTVLLPAETTAARDVARREPARAAGGRVLVIDDDASVRDATSHLLGLIGHDVLTASSGHEGLRLYREHADEIAFVLVDLSMPHFDGRRTLEALRCVTPDAGVILMSGYELPEEDEGLLRDPRVERLAKPFTRAHLERAIDAIDGHDGAGAGAGDAAPPAG